MEQRLQQELLQEIKEKNDIVAIISEYLTLKKAGRSLIGLCPFHGEKTPSFNVNQTKQLFYCFGCGTGGDVFQFLMKIENWDFVTTARHLAERAGIVWPEMKLKTEKEVQAEMFYKINKLAAAYFHQCLTVTESCAEARQYLEERKITQASWIKFNLGFALPGWHNLLEILLKKGVALEQAESLGLLAFGENGYYDRFRDRLIFPVFDPRGKVVGFGGRVLDKNQPKYLNTPETLIFHKSNLLYGLNLAKDAIRKKGQAMIVEGYFDVVQAHQHGFDYTVASQGTSLTREQARLIKRYAQEVILAYDADAAGQQATLRGLEILEEAGLNVKILRLTAGDDPDSFLRQHGQAAFAEILEKVVNLTDFKIELALKKYQINTPNGKTDAVREILPVLGAMQNLITRESYLRKISRELGVSETAIYEELEKWRKSNRKNSPVLDKCFKNVYTNGIEEKLGLTGDIHDLENLTPFEKAVFKAEKELLQLALQEYDKFARIKKELTAGDFSFPLWRELFLQLENLEQLSSDQLLLQELSIASREVAATLIAEQGIQDYQGDLEGLLMKLRMLHLQAEVQNLSSQIASGKNEAGQSLTDVDLKEKVLRFTELKRKLQKEFPHFTPGMYSH